MILLLGDFDLNTPVLGAFQNHESKIEVKEVVTEPTGSASSSPAAAEEDSSETIKSKKRSRWGTKQESASELNGKAEQGIDDGNTEKKRRSRWGNDATDKTSSETTTAMTARSGTQLRNLHQQKTFLLRLKIDDINRKLLTVVQDAKIAENNPERSPSPEPIYDSQGRRINLREARMREGLETKKKEFMEELVKLNPALKPSNMRMSLISKKLYVPVHDYPGYNFLGLIIGPRGLTQKRMETETNTKITIRGKGSVRPGRGKQEEDANEELHILVEGEDQDDVDRAADMVSKLLNPNTDEHILEEHRQKQMQELALINGTIKQDDVCINCGQAGHKLYECPYQSIASFTMANVTCKICGEKSHVTADCPMKNTINGNIPVFAGNDIINEGIDKDYYEFLEMVGGEIDPNSLPAVQASAGPQPLSMSQMNTPVLTPSQSGVGHNSTLPKTTGGQQNFQSGVTSSVIPTVSINQYTPFNTYTAPLPGAIPVAYTVPTHVDLTMRRLPVYSGMVQPVQPLQQAYMLPNNYTLLQQPQYIPPPPPMPTQTQQGNMSRSGLPFPPLPQ